ncbi:MAG: hypothetical protein A2Z11_03540 [Candidatus Woykebacteria bacterium RBG_16_43_9]|uniref:Baseplate protein J-like domain-containing protein n=1 Tax=Candidatus Woykebacteria bacterium RBG_16_43_9 TaxID=1802596 RepID=A0A1G1WCR0_9BACT|nr:MAG: hypothetical protein A2Z11_03540 [Candidatus Woykebacteria bacterium RBG_16_43_9]
MKRLEFDEKNNLADVLKAIQNEPETEIEIYIFPGSEILKDSANKSVIELLAKQLDKKIVLKGEEGPKQVADETTSKKEGKEEDEHGFVEGKDVAEERVGESKFSLPKFPKLKFLKGPRWLFFLAGFIGLVIIAVILTFWLVPTATVTLTAEQKFKESELALIASAEAEEVDVDKGILPLKTLDTTIEDVLETKATGTKTVGTNAKGRVKIVNRDTKNKTFFAGTTIKTISNPILTFTLDETATISASPAGCIADCKETAVNVTAKEIGEKGNLAAGTKFQVGSVTDTTKVVAESLTNFTGGSSKKITVVSANDQKKAKEELLEKMEKKAKEELEKSNPGIVIPEGGLEPQILNEAYSKKTGEEALDFRLSLEVKFTAKIFSEEDLINLMIGSISETLPSGFEIDKEASVVESEILEKGDTDLKILGKIKASLVPIINTDEVVKNISGKDFGSTDKYLKSMNSITSFEIKLSPSVFRIFGTMPFARSRIKVELVQKE